ncbi:hypothetical protein BpHYR1_042070 [Brachionus plicatilis]|uniref:Uncharacterized protein n=1 Tax=Brachionus plicatilis TaxID=10195 RepID=A0A3M7SIW0_BRAPC|nr:hypothetical protein BpHYR1_042070 [Brachionus plicatilis]
MLITRHLLTQLDQVNLVHGSFVIHYRRRKKQKILFGKNLERAGQKLTLFVFSTKMFEGNPQAVKKNLNVGITIKN